MEKCLFLGKKCRILVSMSTLAKNTALLTGASILQKAVAFVYFALIARSVGVEDTGAYFLALAMITTIGVLDDLGCTSVLIRDVARDPAHAKGLLQRTLGIKLVAIPITVAIAFVLPPLMGYSDASAFLVRLAVPIMLADTLSLTFYGVLRGMQELRYESLGIFVGQSLTTIGGVIVIFSGNTSLPLLIGALIAGSVWNALLSAYQVGKRLGVQAFVPSLNGAKLTLGTALPFFLAAVFVKIYSYVDSFTLNLVIGKAAVGFYSVAYKLTYAFQFLPLAFVGALYPRMSSLTNKPEELKRVFLNAEWYMAFLMTPIVFGIAALAPEIVLMMYGKEYLPSVVPLIALIFVLLPIFLDFPVGSLLNATGRQITKTAIMGVTMVVNFAANMVLIRTLGIVGASVAALISFVTMFGLGVFMLRRQIHVSFREWIQTIGGFLLAGIVMMIVVLFAKMIMPWMVTIPVGALVFVTIAVGTRALTLEHWNHARNLLRR